MTFIAGVVVGLLLVPAWRAVMCLRAARQAERVDVLSSERVQMLIRDGAR